MMGRYATAKNVTAGIAIAVGLTFASVKVEARDGCDIDTQCTGGPLYGYTIGCGCGGPGNCYVISPGSEVGCDCDGFAKVRCDCWNGCGDI